MHFSKKALISTALTLSLLAPVFSQAALFSDTQLSAVESALRGQGVQKDKIQKIKMELASTTEREHGKPEKEDDDRKASSTPRVAPGQVLKTLCATLLRNLGPGARGDDVHKLQELLLEDSDSGFTVAPTGFFGPMTAKAVARYQKKYGIASTTTGTVGPLTRAFLQRACGKGLVKATPLPPTADTTKPVLSAIATSNVATSSVTVSWNTNKPATGRVYYAATTTPLKIALAPTFVGLTTLSLTHSFKLTGLATSTVYALVIESKDAALNTATSTVPSITTTN